MKYIIIFFFQFNIYIYIIKIAKIELKMINKLSIYFILNIIQNNYATNLIKITKEFI